MMRCCQPSLVGLMGELHLVDREAVPDAIRRGADSLLIRNSDYDASIADAIRESRHLCWLQFLSSGTDRLALHGRLPSRVDVTNCAEALDPAVAEHALALLLGLLRGIHLAERHRADGEWRRDDFRKSMASLDGARVVVVGFGMIGRNVAKHTSAFGANVTIVRRGGTDADGFAAEPLDIAIRGADAIVLAVPLNDETTHLFDRRRIAMLSAQCRLVNVSRGQIVDTEALADALRIGTIHSAALDVFEEEPLPANDELWNLPNVILTPHVAGIGNPQTAGRIAAVCVRNFLQRKS